MQAAQLLEKGYSQSEVARRVGLHRQSVSQWAAELREKGRAGLKQAGRAGRKSRRSAQPSKTIAQGLQQGPEALGYGTSLWTSARVAHLIERECGVAYHPGHVWRILRCGDSRWSLREERVCLLASASPQQPGCRK